MNQLCIMHWMISIVISICINTYSSIITHRQAYDDRHSGERDMTLRLDDLGGDTRPTRNRYGKPRRPPDFMAFVLLALTICTTALAQLSVSTSSLPLTVALPPLNTSTQAYDLSITSASPITSLYLTLSICSVGSNTSIIPAVLVALDPENFDIDENSVPDRTSGGVEKANEKARGADVWALAWDKGFANWTYVDDEGADSVVMRIGFAEGMEVSEGNVLLQLGASVEGRSTNSCTNTMLTCRTSTSCIDNDAISRRHDFYSITIILPTSPGFTSDSTKLSKLHTSPRIHDHTATTRFQFPQLRVVGTTKRFFSSSKWARQFSLCRARCKCHDWQYCS